MEAGAGSVEAANLRENVLPVVVWHFHALIVISQRGIRHFEGLHGHGADTSEVGLIALVLEDCFLSQLDSVLLLELSDHGLEELQLVLLFNDFRVDLDVDLLLDSSLVKFIAGDLREELEGLDAPLLEALGVEIIAIVFELVVAGFDGGPILPECIYNLLESLLSVLLDPAVDDLADSVIFPLKFFEPSVKFEISFVQFSEFF